MGHSVDHGIGVSIPTARIGWTILLVALVVRLAVLAFALQDPARFLIHDSPQYLLLSEEFFDAYTNSTSDLVGLSLYRTPGYSAFLAIVRSLPGNDLIAIGIMQSLVGALTAVLTFLFTARILNLPAGAVAGGVVALDPLSIVHSVLITSDTLFVLLLVGGLLLFARALVKPSPGGMALTGTALGGTCLVRPIALYLILFLSLITFAALKDQTHRLLLVAALVVGFVIPPGLWVARNETVAGKATFSTIDSKNLLWYTATGTLSLARHISLENAELRLWNRLKGDAGHEPSIESETGLALEVLRDHPGSATLWTLRNVALTFPRTGYHALMVVISGERHTGSRNALWWITVVITSCVYIAAAIGIYVFVRERSYLVLALLFGAAAYFLLISGGVSFEGRYRLPAVPLIAALAGRGGVHLLSSTRDRRRDRLQA